MTHIEQLEELIRRFYASEPLSQHCDDLLVELDRDGSEAARRVLAARRLIVGLGDDQ